MTLCMAEQPPPEHEVVRWGIVQATGIFAVSVSGHSCLPAIRNSMSEPQRFEFVLNLAFTVRPLAAILAHFVRHPAMHATHHHIRSVHG